MPDFRKENEESGQTEEPNEYTSNDLEDYWGLINKEIYNEEELNRINSKYSTNRPIKTIIYNNNSIGANC